ncbi:MAG: BCCT family transporter [Halobacteriota archaeon]
MAMHGASPVEDALRRLLLPVCVVAGMVIVTGFFFPEFVGTEVSGEVWLATALVFVGAGLGYLALLPLEDAEPEETADRDEAYLLRVRRLSWRSTTAEFFDRQDPVTFSVPFVAILAFFVAQIFAPETTLEVIGVIESILLEDLGWVFVGPMLIAVIAALALLLGPWGDIRLGGPDAEPAYTYPVYFSMFFTAGIAAGIVFWGPAEALFHYDTPPPYLDVPPRSEAAVTGALTYALFHWGVSAWSAYIALGIPIAYFVYQRGAPLRVSAILTPFVGVDRLGGPLGRTVDVLAIFATIGGIATSVALVGQQFLTGIEYQWGVATGELGPVVFVAGLSAIFILSAQSGVHRGIRRIANVNILLFAMLGGLLVLLGPRSFMLAEGGRALGTYAVEFVPLSLYVDEGWVADWTVWNWIWWFSWAPFAGLFLAALSRGRTIRTVVLTGVVATSLVTMLWFIIMGGTSVHLQHTGAVDVLGAMAGEGGSEAVAGFPILDALPLSELLIFLFLGLIIVFMTTSADTSTLAVSILASRIQLAPTTGAIVFWGLFQGTVAVAVLVVDGGEVLQTAAVLTGGPIAVLAVVALVGLASELRRAEGADRTAVGAIWGALRRARDPD